MFSINLISNSNSNTYQDFSIFTTPFGKKEGCEVVTTDSNDKKEVLQVFHLSYHLNAKSIHSCRTSYNIRQARPQNIKICAAGFENHSPAFDTCLFQSTEKYLNKGGVNKL